MIFIPSGDLKGMITFIVMLGSLYSHELVIYEHLLQTYCPAITCLFGDKRRHGTIFE